MDISYSATGLVIACDYYLFLLDSQRTGAQGRCFSLDHAGIEGVLGGRVSKLGRSGQAWWEPWRRGTHVVLDR